MSSAAKNTIAATIVVPTTGDRGPLLPYSVGSICKQSQANIEIFIIGDGVSDDTRETINQIVSEDSRVRFFDFPKHERRGEVYRHQALQEARGKIVCYLCDRDLMLENHVSEMLHHLENADICSSYKVATLRAGGFRISPNDMLEPGGAQSPTIPKGLSIVGHTLTAYRDLPHGWRTTPSQLSTDSYMWKQFVSAGARMAHIPIPTIIYIKRGKHPGMSTLERLKEVQSYHDKYIRPGGAAAYLGDVIHYGLEESSRVRLLALAKRRAKAKNEAGHNKQLGKLNGALQNSLRKLGKVFGFSARREKQSGPQPVGRNKTRQR